MGDTGKILKVRKRRFSQKGINRTDSHIFKQDLYKGFHEVDAGWRIVTIDDQPYSLELFKAKKRGTKPYRVKCELIETKIRKISQTGIPEEEQIVRPRTPRSGTPRSQHSPSLTRLNEDRPIKYIPKDDQNAIEDLDTDSEWSDTFS